MELIVLTKDQLDSIIQTSIRTALDEYIEKQIREKSKPDFYTIKETSEKLKVTETTIRNYIKKGLIPADKIGGRIRIRGITLDNTLKEIKSLKYRRIN